jgi:hypothetical protein
MHLLTWPQRRDRLVNMEIKIGLGSLIAMILSWVTNHSLLWLIIHGLLGWLYVIYWIIVRI